MKKQSISVKDQIVIVLPDMLVFVCSDHPVGHHASSGQELNIDDLLIYVPFNEDFGPLNLAAVANYVRSLDSLLNDPSRKGSILYHRTSTDYKKYTNSILLICAYQMIILGNRPEQAFEPFTNFEIPPFKDVSSSKHAFQCTILHCLRGLEYAMNCGWFDLKTFNPKQYMYYSKVQNGDISPIIPNKLYAFSAPSEHKKDRYGNQLLRRKIMAEYQVVVNVSGNRHLSAQFAKIGIKSHDITFNDGPTIPEQIVTSFNEIIQQYERDVKIGVYCNTGLNKTCFLIGSYIIKAYEFKMEQCIGWIRLCRPGSLQGTYYLRLKQYEPEALESDPESPTKSISILKNSSYSSNNGQNSLRGSKLSQTSPSKGQPKKFQNIKRLMKSQDLESSSPVKQRKPILSGSIKLKELMG